MLNGRHCDFCEYHLEEDDYDEYGSWSYTCPECGFHYSHSSELTPNEQVEKFIENQDNDADEEEPDTESE